MTDTNGIDAIRQHVDTADGAHDHLHVRWVDPAGDRASSIEVIVAGKQVAHHAKVTAGVHAVDVIVPRGEDAEVRVHAMVARSNVRPVGALALELEPDAPTQTGDPIPDEEPHQSPQPTDEA